MQVKSEPANFALVGSPGQVIVEDTKTRIIPSDSSVPDAALAVYTGDLRRSKITIRNFDTTTILYWCKSNLVIPFTAAQTPPTFDANTHSYPLGPGEEKSFIITAAVGLWLYNPSGADVTIAYDEEI